MALMEVSDYIALRAEYELGPLSLRALAAKHGLNENTIKYRARTEGWRKEGNTNCSKVAVHKAVQKSANEAVKEVALKFAEKAAGRTGELADIALSKIEDGLKALGPDDTRKLKDLTSAMKDLKDLGFIVVEDNDKGKNDVSVGFVGGEDICT